MGPTTPRDNQPGDCGDPDCDACHFARTQGIEHCSKTCINAGTDVRAAAAASVVSIEEAQQHGALIVDNVGEVPRAELTSAGLVVRRTSEDLGVIIKDRAGVFSRTVQAPALVTPARAITVTLDLGDALKSGYTLQALVAGGHVPSDAADVLNRVGAQLKSAAMAAVKGAAS